MGSWLLDQVTTWLHQEFDTEMIFELWKIQAQLTVLYCALEDHSWAN